jgi:putative DNA primase/helicase
MTEPRHHLDDAGRDALRAVAADIVEAFRGEHNRKLSSRKEWRWGSRGSFSLVITGQREGLWFDHEIGCGGDVLEFIKYELHCSFREALGYASRFVGELRSTPRPRPAPRPTTNDDDDEKRITDALAIWCETRPLRGSLAEGYLQSRSIEVPIEALEVLRFHLRCPWQIGTRPAMVALVRDAITDEPIGIHRTALTADGRKLDRPKLLGPTAGGAIKLSGDITAELTIAEGIETALSAMMLGYGAAWSAIDAGGIAKFPVLPEIERLIIIVDNDVSGTGQKAAAECKARWLAAGRRVRTVMPSKAGEDLNDILQRREQRWSGSNVLDLMRARGRRS